MKAKLIVALDTPEEKRVRELVTVLKDKVDIFKVGLEQYLASRGKVLDYLRSNGKKVFLDLKFHDIPNTVEAAARVAVREGVWMFNMHVSDFEGMKRVAEAALEEAEKTGIVRPLVIGVTVLTSMSEEDLQETGIPLTPQELVIKRALLAQKAGLDGVVASPREAKSIRENCGEDFISVCPGIRPAWAAKGDQKRIMPPGTALKEGAHYLVVGRPITKADDPGEAASKILAEMEEAFK
ncbi:MAG: orotidine-5-phosphate decarboxylase [Clostridia bacterium]|jgi:orotidine-5'-phosphate decarboxylase|nr:orotidine-5-phosphate decarboxylase [Clostridiales bacterium]MDK2985407.1 orotidine-5-phosphate decarboxylase [Clostridia bacterium]